MTERGRLAREHSTAKRTPVPDDPNRIRKSVPTKPYLPYRLILTPRVPTRFFRSPWRFGKYTTLIAAQNALKAVSKGWYHTRFSAVIQHYSRGEWKDIC